MTNINRCAEPGARLADPESLGGDTPHPGPQAGCADFSPDRLGAMVLKPKHEAFARAYARNANGAAAARAAEYAGGNAKTQGAALLRRDDLAMRVSELDAEIKAERRCADRLRP